MILTIIAIVMVLFGFVLWKIGEKSYKYDSLEPLGAINFTIGFIGLILLITMIIVEHSTVQRTIIQNKMEYDGLCKRYEIVTSEYEDVSKSDVIADIVTWNKKVYNRKYWADNPWTNWFNSREVADNLKYISLD